jgi:hypothetical protein
MRINNENTVAVWIGAHCYLLNQRMIIRMGALENKKFSCKSSNLTFFVFIGTIHQISSIPTFRLQAPVRAVKAIGTERKGSRWLSDRIKTQLEITVWNGALSAGPLFDSPPSRKWIHNFREFVV